MIAELMLLVLVKGAGMATDISDKVISLRVKNSIETSECSGTLVLAGRALADAGTVAKEKEIDISLGYGTETLVYRGVISRVDIDDPPNEEARTTVELMSYFKNYRKQTVNTPYYPDATDFRNVLNELAQSFIGLPPAAVDFSFTPASYKMSRFRLADITVADAMRQLCEAFTCELGWHNGVLTLVSKVAPVTPQDTYRKERCIKITEDTDTLGRISKITVMGQEYTPDMGTVETVGTLIVAPSSLPTGVDSYHFPVYLTTLPADNLYADASSATPFAFTVEWRDEKRAIVKATRVAAGAPAGDITVDIKGRVYLKGRVQNERTWSDALLDDPGYIAEVTLDNPFIQTKFDAGYVGTTILAYNALAEHKVIVTAPHNPALRFNEILRITDGGVTIYNIQVREIETTFDANNHQLIDVITGWKMTV